MDLEKKALLFLFESYDNDSNQLYDIVSVCGKDALLVANKLLKQNYIKDNVESNGTSVACSITMTGIESVEPGFIQKKFDEFFPHTGPADTIWNVVEILKQGKEGFQLCFDLANEMQNRDLVKLLYAFYPSKVMVEMTLEGARLSGK